MSYRMQLFSIWNILHASQSMKNCKSRLLFFCLYDEGNTTVDELMMRLMGAMEIFTAQQQEDIKDEVRWKLSSLQRQHFKVSFLKQK